MTKRKRTERPNPFREPAAWHASFEGGVIGSEHDGDVDVVVRTSGKDREAIFMPRGISRLGEEGFDQARELQRITSALRIGTERLDVAVLDARVLGFSWDSIGFCVGTTGEAARQRWGHFNA